jgi:Mg2+/citrate symporter
VLVAHTTVAFAGYFAFGGWRYFGRGFAEREVAVAPAAAGPDGSGRFEWRHWLTLAVIGSLITAVVFLNVNVGMGALAGAVVLVLVGAADESSALRALPWSPIVMVCGVTVLVAFVETSGGMEMFSTLLARSSSLATVTGFTALVTGAISIFSSTAGVVLPAFLPTVPGLIRKLGGGDPMAIASSMIIGAHLVDVSPLSTTGALLISAAPANADTRQLFRWMLAWGVSMTVVAAVGCYLIFGLSLFH